MGEKRRLLPVSRVPAPALCKVDDVASLSLAELAARQVDLRFVILIALRCRRSMTQVPPACDRIERVAYDVNSRIELLVVVDERCVLRRDDRRERGEVRLDEKVKAMVALAVESTLEAAVAVCGKGTMSARRLRRRMDKHTDRARLVTRRALNERAKVRVAGPRERSEGGPDRRLVRDCNQLGLACGAHRVV